VRNTIHIVMEFKIPRDSDLKEGKEFAATA
jgi:hypothetical protein